MEIVLTFYNPQFTYNNYTNQTETEPDGYMPPASRPLFSQVYPVPYLSPCPLVLLSLQKIQQHLKQSGVLPIGLYHIARAGYQLAQGPQRHLQGQKIIGSSSQDDRKASRAMISV